MHFPPTDADLRLFDLSAPTPLPDGGSWTAALVERDSWYAMTLRFEVTVRHPDGRTDTFPASVTDPEDTHGEPEASRRSLHLMVCGRLGIRP